MFGSSGYSSSSYAAPSYVGPSDTYVAPLATASAPYVPPTSITSAPPPYDSKFSPSEKGITSCCGSICCAIVCIVPAAIALIVCFATVPSMHLNLEMCNYESRLVSLPGSYGSASVNAPTSVSIVHLFPGDSAQLLSSPITYAYRWARLTLSSWEYQYIGIFANHGTDFKFDVATSLPVAMYVLRGDDMLSAWINDGFTCVDSRVLLSGVAQHYIANADDTFYFALEDHNDNAITLQMNVTVAGTKYDSTIFGSRQACMGGSCSFDIGSGQAHQLILTSPWSGAYDVNTYVVANVQASGRVGTMLLAITLPLLAVGVLVFFCCVAPARDAICCKPCLRSQSEKTRSAAASASVPLAPVAAPVPPLAVLAPPAASPPGEVSVPAAPPPGVPTVLGPSMDFPEKTDGAFAPSAPPPPPPPAFVAPGVTVDVSVVPVGPTMGMTAPVSQVFMAAPAVSGMDPSVGVGLAQPGMAGPIPMVPLGTVGPQPTAPPAPVGL